VQRGAKTKREGEDGSARILPDTVGLFSRYVDRRVYELSDHLGNVRAIVGDVKLPVSGLYKADLKGYNNYYPFGMLQPDRHWSSDSYRYGYNGKEKDDEIKGKGTSYDFGARMYDPRMGRFLSIDPLSSSFPWYSPYQYAGNSPIYCIDLDGLERVNVSLWQLSGSGLPLIRKSQWYVISGHLDRVSFANAAKYNVKNNNPGAYQNIEDRHNWYQWAETETKSRGNYWFAAASDVTSMTMVGGADLINLGFMNDEEEKILRGANKFLLQENFKNFGQYVLGTGPVTWKGQSFEHLNGAALDNQMVVIEMTTLQGYLDDYKKNYIAQNGQEAWDELHSGLNSLFSNAMLGTFTPASNKYAQEEFKKHFGEDTDFDFMNLDHRIFQGQKMAEYIRNHGRPSVQLLPD